MKNVPKLFSLVAVLAGLLLGTSSLAAQDSTNPAGPLVRVTVTAVGRTNPVPEVTQPDVLVYQGRDRRPVTDWQAVEVNRAAGLDLAILLDENLDSAVGLQLNDLADFVRSLPPEARVGVAYARNGTAAFTQTFTTDHERAAKALRLPLGRTAAFNSPNLSLVDLMKRWPEDNNRREVLLVSSGIDLFRGVADSSPGVNPDLDRAIRVAQREGIIVHTIYARGAGRAYRNFFLISNGQGTLSRLAYETGGEAYFQGFDTPIAFEPYLTRLRTVLDNQYLLTFRAEPAKKAGYQRLRVTTEVPMVELVAPEHVYIPSAS